MNDLLGTPPAVSAIIPARDARATLGDALDSLLAQTIPDWEAIIVDDGSTDGTGEIAMAYAARDRRVRLLRTEAGSAAAARNAGLALARGRRLLFLDADDWIAPTHLERLLGMLAAAPDATAAYCGFRRVAPDGGIGPATWRADIAAGPIQAFAHRPGTAIHAVLVDRAAVAALGGFNPGLPVCEDWDLWQRLAFGGARFVGTPEPLAFYRMRAESLSHRHRQLLHDGLVVLRRAAATLGEAGASWQLPATYLAIWCAAAEIGAGRDGVPLLEESGLAVRPGDDLDALRNTLLEGMVVGAAVTLPSLAQDWLRVAARLGALLQWLEDRGKPGLARKLTYAIEWRVLAACDLATPLSLGLTMGVRVDLRRPEGLTPPSGVDVAMLHLCDGAEVLRTVQLPLLGPVPPRALVTLAIEELWLGRVWRRSGAAGRPAVWWAAVRAAIPLGLRAVAARVAPGRVASPASGPRALARMALAQALVASAGPAPGPGSSAEVLAGIRCQALDDAAGLPRVAATGAPAQGGSAVAWNDADRRAYWEALFETADPWDYGSGYETEKYRRTLDLLPEAPVGQALELACAEGHFTRLLAPRVGRLLATDIAERALVRATERCAGIDNIAFQRLDLEAEALPGGLDLIVCSEVLYYLADEATLRAVAGKFRDALAPGGHLLTAHAFVLGDDPGRTGFDWEHAFGAATIARTLASTPGLVADRIVETDLYCIARYRRDDATAAPPATAEALPLVAALAPEVARQVVWGGAEARRRDLRQRETTESVPVLMYHRVAEDGPPDLARFRVTPAQFEAQLRLLRRRGWHAISSAELRWFIAARQPVPGRPVLITFDDGYRDFLDHAWPILRANDFGAEVFVPTDLVGGEACWDAAYGAPAPLLGWEEIGALAREGVVFGSHLARHADGLGLSSAALAAELARSRATLEARLGREVRSFAAPYGGLDERFARLAAGCGYHVGFSTSPAWARLDDPPLMLPRIEVRGDWDLDTFSDAMKPPR